MTPQPAAAHLPLDPAVTAATLATIFGAQRPDRDRTSAPLDPQHEAGALIAALRPRDPLETAYATRAAAAHYGSIECFRRALLPDVPDEAAIRWHGKAVALSRMNTDMVRLLTERQAATPREQSQPAGRPGMSPLAVLEEAMRRATARAAKPVGERDPVPSERPALTPSASASTPQPEAAVAAKPAGRQAAVSSERPLATPAAPVLRAQLEAALAGKPVGKRDPMSSERPSSVPAAGVLATQQAGASFLPAALPRQSLRAELCGSSTDAAAMLAAADVRGKLHVQ